MAYANAADPKFSIEVMSLQAAASNTGPPGFPVGELLKLVQLLPGVCPPWPIGKVLRHTKEKTSAVWNNIDSSHRRTSCGNIIFVVLAMFDCPHRFFNLPGTILDLPETKCISELLAQVTFSGFHRPSASNWKQTRNLLGSATSCASQDRAFRRRPGPSG